MDVKITSQETDDPVVADARTLTIGLITLSLTHEREAVVTACVTAAAILLLGRLLRDHDPEVLDIVTDFVRRVQDCKDVLREDATNVAPEPDQVM